MFNIFINSSIAVIKSLDIGVDIDGLKVGMISYADDTVFNAGDENNLQVLLYEDSICY